MTRSIRASTLRGEVRLKGIRPLNLEAGFIRDDATAARYLADTAHRFAMPRRVISLLLPFTFNALEEGELIEYLPIGKSSGEGIFARITTRADEGGWLRITAEEILM